MTPKTPNSWERNRFVGTELLLTQEKERGTERGKQRGKEREMEHEMERGSV